jgi:uncharacterized phage protein gp47/JayE
MALKIPTTIESTEQNVTTFETTLNQSVPLTDQAFSRVVAFIQAGSQTGLYKYSAERILQNFALTATGEDLDRIGNEYGVVRKPASAAVIVIEMTAASGTSVDVTNAWIGDSNGVRYIPDSGASESGGEIEVTVTSEETGVAGNLNVNDTLTIESQVAGVSSKATVVNIETLGTERETDDAYRERILNEIRTVGGGGNGVDYRTWATETPGVFRAFPYSGRPPDAGTSYPGERVVYIEADSSLDIDGIADQNLLDSAREYIDHDPITEQTRTPLGLPNLDEETLWVESIERVGIYVEVRNLTVDADKEAQLKDDLEEALDTYLREITMFVDGVDVEIERNDTITSVTVSTVSQDVFSKYGASASSVAFGTEIGVYLTSYVLGMGELAKLQQITYVTV